MDLARAEARSKSDQALTSSGTISVPGPFLATKCGALRTCPLRTMPGKPHEMRSPVGQLLGQSSVSFSTRRSGGIG